MDTSNSKKALTEPLLGILPSELEKCDVTESRQLEASIDDNDDFTWCETIIVHLILPGLLLLQFGMAFYMDRSQGQESASELDSLSWPVVNWSILMFVVTSYLFRSAMRDCQVRWTFIILLPEIIMDLILGLILIDKTVTAFLVLLISMLCLALIVVATSVHALWCQSHQEEDELDETSAGSFSTRFGDV